MNYEKRRLKSSGQWNPSWSVSKHTILSCHHCNKPTTKEMKVIYGELAWKSYGDIYVCDDCVSLNGFNER